MPLEKLRNVVILGTRMILYMHMHKWPLCFNTNAIWIDYDWLGDAYDMRCLLHAYCLRTYIQNIPMFFGV